MKRTLYELFMECDWNACRVPWRIYGETINWSAQITAQKPGMNLTICK